MREFISKELIDKGWSEDRKYRVEDKDKNVFLLRVSPSKKLSSLQNLFALMQKVDALGVPMCRPIELEERNDGVYFLQSYIEGDDAEAIIPSLDEESQYSYGLDAGRTLRRIHTVPAPCDIPSWDKRFQAKIDRKLSLYSTCPLKYDNGQLFIDYIAENRHLITNRPQCFQHGDFHIGNMMISQNRVFIIDFDRNDYGDPWEEFNRIVWSAQVSPAFARGTVDGYFGKDVPELFWRLLALYIASNTLSSLPWAIPFGEQEIQVMKNQAEDILRWYDNMKDIIPSWYKK